MSEEDLELDEDIGEAMIVYEDPDGETIEKTVPNEHAAYFQDHWILKTGEDDQGRDVVRRIPAKRVYYVERTVEEFEEEVATLLDRVESVATSLQTKLPIGGGGGEKEEESSRLDIDVGDAEESDTDSR